ncbi:hypothetical protein C8E00_102377 [Chromohalobacter marismortui]|uniref:Uncharacterized protein n=1 Tax=Chromohalobacter marismortui TaxID=42055 RepID=A0A4R7NSI1_9GAMM|nr:hypothetical protein C8E00_102377 [Chromohalobacter marismortui]
MLARSSQWGYRYQAREAIWRVTALDHLETAVTYSTNADAFVAARPAAAHTSSSDAADNFANARPLALTGHCGGLQGQKSKTPAREPPCIGWYPTFRGSSRAVGQRDSGVIFMV